MNNKRDKSGFTDDDVIRSVKNGNTRNFEIIVERYKSKIINFIFRMIDDYDEARNISQEVFFLIYKNISKYNEKRTFSSFIYTVAKNTTLNYIKKRKRVVLFSALSEKGEEERIVGEKGDPQTEFRKNEKERIVTEGLKKLNVNQRLALILKVYLGFSYKQIAGITGWSQPKIETLISRGKVNLKKIVLGDLQEKGGMDVST